MGATPNWIAEMTGDDHSSQPIDEELWIDGCGGYRLVVGSRWKIGGPDFGVIEDADPVIRIQADVPRIAGELTRVETDYVWQGASGEDADAKPVLVGPDHPIPMVGSARLFLNVPSPLSPSAVLSLDPPHRFSGHVDGVILVTDTVLIGPGRECHVRCPAMEERCVLSVRQPENTTGLAWGRWGQKKANQWRLIRSGQPPQDLSPNQRLTIQDVSMTLVQN